MKKMMAAVLAVTLCAPVIPAAANAAAPVTSTPVITAPNNPTPVPQVPTDTKGTGKADAIVQTALDLVGRAQYGSYSESRLTFDCSGFVYYVFKKNGIDLKTRDDDKQVKLGRYVAKRDLQKGDLVFFNANPSDRSDVTHVGIYIGDGKIVHSANSRSDVTITSLDSSWYTKYYKNARRVF